MADADFGRFYNNVLCELDRLGVPIGPGQVTVSTSRTGAVSIQFPKEKGDIRRRSFKVPRAKRAEFLTKLAAVQGKLELAAFASALTSILG